MIIGFTSGKEIHVDCTVLEYTEKLASMNGQINHHRNLLSTPDPKLTIVLEQICYLRDE